MELRSAGMTEERNSTPLEPDTLVPAQYFDRVGSDAAFQPEKRLMLAVLEEAIATFQRHVMSDNRRSQRLVEEVETWTSGAEASWPFSFENFAAVSRMISSARRYRSPRSGTESVADCGVVSNIHSALTTGDNWSCV